MGRRSTLMSELRAILGRSGLVLTIIRIVEMVIVVLIRMVVKMVIAILIKMVIAILIKVVIAILIKMVIAISIKMVIAILISMKVIRPAVVTSIKLSRGFLCVRFMSPYFIKKLLFIESPLLAAAQFRVLK